MSTSFYEYTISGSVADGDYLSPNMRKDLERGYVSIVFYSDAQLQNPVTPSAGTVTFTASEEGIRYGTVSNGTVDATTDAYDRPNWSGRVLRLKATTSGIVGASFFKATISKYGSL